ncbi:hypothetical protein Syn7502_00259 [Synechococcus sp. PCC 7502]|uniref:class I SAM-dependent methyltransferase n=1 Tax=Synechococcus sp. PCC 7502 TaxID=1173263 RepID=UPI00029F9D58|nr:methyltransferase domain-containing protein [Synechococcus sp. PCC 7502]AFY72426.1 hypothetical protein Syn7502_00259 [Synechococcus sp. PCC 7502]
MSQSIAISQATRYQNAALNYYLGLTDSPFLHYGYWEPLPSGTEELTISRLRSAQQAYTDKLVSFIPSGTKTILDVGCGTGGNAGYLLNKGFDVEGLAPDPFQQERFLSYTQGKAKFHLSTLENFNGNFHYDLILLSESSQYISVLDIARCSTKLLNAGGYLLIADMMRSNSSYQDGIFSNCHDVKELLTALTESGFTLVKCEDISTQAAPTIDLAVANFQRFGLSTINYLADLSAIAVPPIHKLLRWAYRRWLKKIVTEGLDAPKIFEQNLCYQIQLWQISKS